MNVMQLTQTHLASGNGQGKGCDVNRQPKLALVNAHRAGMIVVVMRNHQRINITNVASDGCQALLGSEAFLSLTLFPNDSAESFMARDAFWHAMLGNC